MGWMQQGVQKASTLHTYESQKQGHIRTLGIDPRILTTAWVHEEAPREAPQTWRLSNRATEKLENPVTRLQLGRNVTSTVIASFTEPND